MSHSLESDVDGHARSTDQACTGRYGGAIVTSAFQPIVSPTYRRIIGHEALMRSSSGPPLSLLAAANERGEAAVLDEIARTTHLRNYVAQTPPDNTWLFLNVGGDVFINEWKHASPIQTNIHDSGLIVLEVLESSRIDLPSLAEAAAAYRALGYLIAIDDFGAGESNFERVWQLRPDIVKLDISLSRRVIDPRAGRIVTHLVAMLHQLGVVVVAEGVETLDEASALMAADVDLFQGYWIQRPQSQLADHGVIGETIEALWDAYRRNRADQEALQAGASRRMKAAVKASSIAWQGSQCLDTAAKPVLETAGGISLMILDANGRQIHGPTNSDKSSDNRFRNLKLNINGDWSRRNYYQQAIANPGKVVQVGPQMSHLSERNVYMLAVYAHDVVICAAFSEETDAN